MASNKGNSPRGSKNSGSKGSGSQRPGKPQGSKSNSSGSKGGSGYKGKSSGSKGGSGYKGKSSGSKGGSGYKGKSGSSQGKPKGGSSSSGSSYSSKGSKPGSRSGHSQSSGRDSSRYAADRNTSGSQSQAKASGGKKKQYSATTRDVERIRREEYASRRRDLKGAAVNLPDWVIESVVRVTPNDRVAPTLEALGAASEALADGKYQAAVRHGQRAKSLSPQDATIRETLGIAAYRLGDWKLALTELRAYRRIAGETTHLPIEMDVLRAQGRNKDVESAWVELKRRGGHGLVMNEGKIVYASYLIDEGRARDAWKIVNPGKLEQNPNEAHLRLYFVAARAAAAAGDRDTARQLSDAIVMNDPSFPGYEQLEREIAAISE